MVKQAIKKKRASGRPRGDPEDLRTARIAIRLHPDLTEVVNAACRYVGLNRSIFIERCLIEWCNAHANEINSDPLDAIGRFVDPDAQQPRAMPGPSVGLNSMFNRIPSISSPATKRFAVGARRKPRAMKDPVEK